GIDLEQCSPAKRLEIFKQHCKEDKAFFSGGPIQKLLDFAKIIKHFVHKKLDKVVTRKVAVEESSSTALAPKLEKRLHEEVIKLSTISAAFLANHPTVMPTPDAIKIPGPKIPGNA
ncbi:MAG: hypothetical protein K0R24_2455, partial [Gammaproteobacteria bacterium]|nr:hypothetical protein [Gammaproteobacteria bacterium]